MATMKDQSVVKAYAEAVTQNVYNHWGTLTCDRRAKLIHAAVTASHKKCGVEPTKLSKSVSPGNDGAFQFESWKLAIDPTLLDRTTIDRDGFVEIAGTFYHEGRHCEQWWHIARLVAMTERSFVNLANSLGICKIAAGMALTKKMNPRYDSMRNLAEIWYKSIYGSHGNQRNVVLKILTLRRTGHTQTMHGFRNGAYQNYSGNLPEEKDAFAVEKLVTDKLINTLPPPPLPGRAGRAPRPH